MKSLLVRTFTLAAFLIAILPLKAEKEALRVEVPLNDKAALSLDFSGPAWVKAGQVDRFEIMGKSLQVMGLDVHEAPENPTRLYVTRDARALYLGFECKDKDMANFQRQEAEEGPGWPQGDRVEIYLVGSIGDPEAYHHFVFNAAGVRGESKERRAAIPRKGWEVKTRVEADGWLAVVKIPYELLGDSSREGLRGLFFRDYHPHAKGGSERSTWGGGALHNPAAFGDLIFIP